MLAIAILAAGKGTRMKSNLPKVLQPLGGKTLVERVLESCNGLNPDRTFLIVGHQAERIREKLNHLPIVEFVQQIPQNGTGHAIQQLIPILNEFEGDLLVLNGDVPLLKRGTIEKLIKQHRISNAGVTLLTSKLSNPKGYGRVFADKSGQVSAIVEDRDCNAKQKENTLINAGIYCFKWSQLKVILPKISNENEQNELYLTDTVSMFDTAMHLETDEPEEISGINNRIQMAVCESILQQRLRNYWMSNGVSFVDEHSCTISEYCKFGRDVVIEPQTHLRGSCIIGDNCKIGPGSFIDNSELGVNVKVLYSVVSNAKVNDDVEIGPYTHLRPETIIAAKCKVGNFVEIKKSILGESTKVNHLSYIGDSELGERVNIGAGTITANYNGREKHQTIIGDATKTGANSVLVAPIILGEEVTVGAGSTLTKNVPSGSLALGRAKQLTINGWSNQFEID